LRLMTLLLPEAYLEGLDRLVRIGSYHSRSSAIRYAVMDLLKRELWRQEKEGKQERKSKRAGGADKEGVQMAKMKMNRRKIVHRKKQ